MLYGLNSAFEHMARLQKTLDYILLTSKKTFLNSSLVGLHTKAYFITMTHIALRS